MKKWIPKITHDKKRWHTVAVFLITLVVFAFIYHYKPAFVRAPYPKTQELKNIANLLCEEVVSGGIGANESCDEPSQIGGGAMLVDKIKYERYTRIGNTDEYEGKKAWIKSRIHFNIKDNVVYTKQEGYLDDPTISQDRFTIQINNDETMVATSLIPNDEKQFQNTSNALVLSKKRGVLIHTSTGYFKTCGDSISSYSRLYTCRENNQSSPEK